MANSNQPYSETFSIPQGPSKPPWKIILGVIIVGLILGGYLIASEIAAQSREIHIVNGTDTPYDIKINGNSISLPPNRPISVTVPEGEVTIERIREDGSIDILKVHIQTPMLTRLFNNDTFIVNPDQTAILLWERIGYGEDPGFKVVEDAFDYKYHTGEKLFNFKNIDYLFVHSPARILVEESSPVSTRNRISIIKPDSAEESLALIESEISSEAARAYLDNYLLASPDSYEHLIMLRDQLSNQQFLDYLKPFVEKRPVLLNCHYVYITAMRNKDIEFDLVPQYRKLLAGNPNDPKSIFLLGLAIPDRTESLALYRKAAENPDAPDAVHHSLFLNYLSNAQFNEALSEIGVLRKTDREDLHYMMHEFDTLVALKQESKALKLVRACSRKRPLDAYVALWKITLEFLVNGAEKAGYAADGFRQEMLDEYSESDYDKYWKTFLAAHLQYISGDGELSAQTLSQEDTPYTNFMKDITLGNFEKLDAILNELDEDVDDYLTAALAALDDGDQVSAKPWLDKAAELLEINAGKTSRRIAGWLRSPSPHSQQIDSNLICNYSTHVTTKRLLLAVMALLDPINETQYFTLARKLNFDRQFPYLLIKQVIGE